MALLPLSIDTPSAAVSPPQLTQRPLQIGAVFLPDPVLLKIGTFRRCFCQEAKECGYLNPDKLLQFINPLAYCGLLQMNLTSNFKQNFSNIFQLVDEIVNHQQTTTKIHGLSP
jgi:hypothetical protein